ncbi:MAG TPA: tetratricopeptide repeat protein, partial [Gammaproteobacteria bacterium]|nr:tetratricopeptide repeat protein [Gammaproteobacteria bacterium]
MEGYSTEQETLTALRAWWDKNGKYVVGGLVIAALVIGGWRGWNYWQSKRAGEAAGLYAAVVAAERQNNDPAIVKAAEALIAAYPDSAYGALAGLAEARAQVEQQQLPAAETALRRVAGNSPDEGLAAVANLRLARVQIQAGDAKGALATL